MKLNNKYLHKILMESVNNFISEDNSSEKIDYIKDIINGEIHDVVINSTDLECETEAIGESKRIYQILVYGEFDYDVQDDERYVYAYATDYDIYTYDDDLDCDVKLDVELSNELLAELSKHLIVNETDQDFYGDFSINDFDD